MSKEIQRGLKLTKALRKHHADFPPNGLAIFLCVAADEGQCAVELVERLEIPKATVSRNLRMLGSRLSAQKEGLHLLRTENDPVDIRLKRSYLTDKGKAFLEDLTQALK